MMKKTILKWIISPARMITCACIGLALCAFTFSVPVYANAEDDVYADDDYPSYEAAIWDEADLLTDAEEEDLYSYLDAILPYGNAIVFTTYLDNGENFERYAENTYYEYYGNEPGVLFQIDMGNRKLTLTCSTGMENLIGHERSSIVDNIYTYASNGDYYACCKNCFIQINTVLHRGEIAHTMKYIDNALLAIILALVLNFIIIFIGSTKKRNVSKVLLSGSVVSAIVAGTIVNPTRTTRRYDPVSSGSGSSGGGGGGGGFSGGSSSHGF